MDGLAAQIRRLVSLHDDERVASTGISEGSSPLPAVEATSVTSSSSSSEATSAGAARHCSICGSVGHIKSRCYSFKAKLRGEGSAAADSMSSTSGITSTASTLSSSSSSSGSSIVGLEHEEEEEEVLQLEAIPWSSLLPEGPSPILGAGGFGVVFKANWLKGKAKRHVPVAVKIFKLLSHGRAGMSTYARMEKDLLDEARLMHRASDGDVNVFVVKLLGVSSGLVTPSWLSALGVHAPTVLVNSEEEGGGGAAGGMKMLALIMKFEAGGTLEQLMYNPSSPWTAKTQERLALLLEVATGIWHLHNSSDKIITHGDIKPENVLLSAPPERHVRLSDFGLSTARETVSSIYSASSMREIEEGKKEESGTWMYKAPEMYKRGKTTALKASRSTDIYAFGTLAWEVLTNEKPWFDCEAVDRLLNILNGESLDLDKLPLDTPGAVREMIASCLALERLDRPQIDEVRICLEQAHHTMQQGEFDIFLSYAWGKDDCRKPLADQVFLCLTNAGYRVWMDTINMELNLDASMTKGITHSKLVVVLFSPDYVASRACNHELREANRLGKPLVVCMVEPNFWRNWRKVDGSTPVISAESEVIELAKLTKQLYADCSEAATGSIDWADKDNLTSEQRRILTHGEKAMPMLTSLVHQAMRGGGVRGIEEGVEAISVAASVPAKNTTTTATASSASPPTTFFTSPNCVPGAIHPSWPFNMLRVRKHADLNNEFVAILHLPRFASFTFLIDLSASTATHWKVALGTKALLEQAGCLVPSCNYDEASQGYIVRVFEGHEALALSFSSTEEA